MEHESVGHLTRDLVRAATSLSAKEARYLVDAYYIMQEDRKRADNQVRSMADEPHTLIGWLGEQSSILEHQIKRALQSYAQSSAVGEWAVANYGIGPVIAAGLLAHIDISKAPTVGHIWSFAGQNPNKTWEKGHKRPWNAQLKTLCWKIGQSFMKFSGNEECVYGQVYRERKAYEIARNDRMENIERASFILAHKNFGKTTEAYKAYAVGKLPPAHIDAQARRYSVKLFLSHLHLVWWFSEFNELPAKPYALGQLDHTHFIRPQHLELINGLPDAMRKAGL